MARSTNSPFVKVARARAKNGEGERWDFDNVSPTLNVFDNGDSRAVVLVAKRQNQIMHCFDNSTRARNPSDCGNTSPTLQAHLGTGGGNVPIIIQKKK